VTHWQTQELNVERDHAQSRRRRRRASVHTPYSLGEPGTKRICDVYLCDSIAYRNLQAANDRTKATIRRQRCLF